MKRTNKTLATLLIAGACTIPLTGCGLTNPETPAGHEGYVVDIPYFIGQGGYVDTIEGPGKLGLGWRNFVTNVDMRPKNYTEQFQILAKDELNIDFNVHAKIQIRDGTVRDVVEHYGEDWYNQFVKEPFRTYVRDAVKDYTSREAKDNRKTVRTTILHSLTDLTESTPFEVLDVSVGNIDYPEIVKNAVEQKLARQQELEEMATKKQIATEQAHIRVEEAKGIAEAQGIINKTLTPQYLQHEAIEAAKELAGSDNTTFYFVPTNPDGMGMPLVLEAPTSN